MTKIQWILPTWSTFEFSFDPTIYPTVDDFTATQHAKLGNLLRIGSLTYSYKKKKSAVLLTDDLVVMITRQWFHMTATMAEFV